MESSTGSILVQVKLFMPPTSQCPVPRFFKNMKLNLKHKLSGCPKIAKFYPISGFGIQLETCRAALVMFRENLRKIFTEMWPGRTEVKKTGDQFSVFLLYPRFAHVLGMIFHFRMQ